MQQQGVVAQDDVGVLPAGFVPAFVCQQLRESDDGVQRGADFVAHVGQERRLEFVGLLGALLRFAQLLLLGAFEFADVVVDARQVDHALLRTVVAAEQVDFDPAHRLLIAHDAHFVDESPDFSGFEAFELLLKVLPVVGMDLPPVAENL